MQPAQRSVPSLQQDFILASSSPRRLMLLRQLSLEPFQVISPDIDETPLKGERPRPYAQRMAFEKAQAGAARCPGQIILAADTTVACGQRILPPADNEGTARQCLKLLSGRRHQVYSAVCLIDAQNRERARITRSIVHFKRLHEDEIQAYLASMEWQGKAGGYAIQGLAACFVQDMRGSYSGVVGLPLFETRALLQSANIHVF